MSKSFTILMAMALMAPPVALAGPYLGVGTGGVRMESSLATLSNGSLNLVPGIETDLAVMGSDPDFSSSDVTFDVTAGWMFGEHFGIEVGYTDFGRASQNYVLPEIPVEPITPRENCLDNNPNNDGLGCQSREWTAQVDMTAIRAFINGYLPLGENFDAYAKVGLVNWDADYRGFERNEQIIPGDSPIGVRNETVTFDKDGTDLAAGIGLVMKTGTAFTLRADFSYYDVDTTDLLWTAELIGVYKFDW